MAAKTPNTRQEQDDAYNPGELKSAEQFGGTHSATAKADSADDVRDEEANGGWKTTYIGGRDKNGNSKKMFFGKTAKKKGPMALVLSLLLGGGIGLGGLFAPAGALIHIKEVVANRFDSNSSIVSTRSDFIMEDRMFGTGGTIGSKLCAIKVKCKYSGLKKYQMQRLRQMGGDLLDKNGKPVTQSKLTQRYTGGKTLVMPDGTKVKASQYKKVLKSNAELRDLSRAVFAPRWFSWNGVASTLVRMKARLVTKPEWGKEGDQKEARASVHKAVAGESSTLDVNSEKNTTEKDKKTGKDKPVAGENVNGLPQDAAEVNKEGAKLNDLASKGELVPQIPSDPAGVAMMPDTPTAGGLKSGLGKALNFLNPASLVTGLCVAYQASNAIVATARTIELENAMRYSTQFLSTADMIKSDDPNVDEGVKADAAEKAMTILQRQDDYGDDFGDSVGYQYSEYNTVPEKPVTSSALGGGAIRLFAAAVGWVNDHLGGKSTVKNICKVFTNPFVVGALSLTSFIPGAGAAFKVVTKTLSTVAKKEAEKIIKDKVESLIVRKVKEKMTKEAFKKAAASTTKVLFRYAKSAIGMFLTEYMLKKYFIPYMARAISSTSLTGSEDGVKAMDTIANGFDAENAMTGQQEGLAPLSKGEYSAFKEFNDKSTNQYVADMRAKSNMFDINDPYSASNSVVASMFNFSSKLKTGGLLSAPATILSALNPSKFIAPTTLADDSGSSITCEDKFLDSHNLATSPFCNVRYGFNDINMLEGTDPNAVIDWMYAHKQIDEDGEPVADSDYATFKDKCNDNATGKFISDVGNEDDLLDPICYSTKNKTEEWKYFHLYTIDNNTQSDMDQDPPKDQSSNVKYIAIGNIPITGKDVGASVFGGKQKGGGLWQADLADNGDNDNGYGLAGHLAPGAKTCNKKDPHLTNTISFAELDMGKALGDLPACTKLEIKFKPSGKTIIASKQDIGSGGGNVNGLPRAVDLWWQSANALGFNVGTGVVTIHAVDPSTPETTVNAAASTGGLSRNIASTFNFNRLSPAMGGVGR